MYVGPVRSAFGGFLAPRLVRSRLRTKTTLDLGRQSVKVYDIELVRTTCKFCLHLLKSWDTARCCSTSLSSRPPLVPAMTFPTPTAASAMMTSSSPGGSRAGRPRLSQGEGHRPDGHSGAHCVSRGRLYPGSGGPLHQRPRSGWDDTQNQPRRGRHRPGHPVAHVDGG